MSAVNDPNGLVVASDLYETMQLMKYVKGEPLYGKEWSIHREISESEYIKEFKKIQSLPDETFAEYMREVIRIRENGYNTDSINPNNFLLDGEHIRIIDLEKSLHVLPKLDFNDLDPFVNTYNLYRLFKTMPKKKIYHLANIIKTFCDRMMDIAKKEGYSLNIPNYINDKIPQKSHLICYMYYQNWDMIKRLIKT